MRRITLLFVLSLSLSAGHAMALQGKSTDAPGQVKKRAHGDILKWIKVTGRKPKAEIAFYNDLISRGVPSKKALVSMKLIIEHDLETGKLGHFVRAKTKAGVKGTSLADAIHKEVQSRRDTKIKLKAKGKSAGKAGGKDSPAKPKAKPEGKRKDEPKGKAKGKPKGKSKGKSGK